jgi:hypothetical protein
VWNVDEWAEFGKTAFEGGWPYSTDPRHVRFIYEAAMVAGSVAVLEIGCFDGFTTSAFVQAVLDGAPLRVTCVDRCVRPGLVAVAARAGGRVEVAQADSLELLVSHRYDLVFVDGDHSIAQVSRELGHLLAQGCRTIVAHDVGDVAPAFGGDGSLWLGRSLVAHPEYLTRVDQVQRVGEFTERGLLFATRDPHFFAATSAAWAAMLI